jgi:hypothetical protein
MRCFRCKSKNASFYFNGYWDFYAYPANLHDLYPQHVDFFQQVNDPLVSKNHTLNAFK